MVFFDLELGSTSYYAGAFSILNSTYVMSNEIDVALIQMIQMFESKRCAFVESVVRFGIKSRRESLSSLE